MFNWKLKATNAIYLEDNNGQEGRPFKSRFLQAGLVKYDFGVCLLKKETIDKFVNTFVECPVIIDHKDNLTEADRVGTIQKIWFSSDDGWFWCSGIITDEKAIELIENGYNVSCQYRITDYIDNDEGKLHNANPYDKEILDGVFEHLAIVENPRYEDAFIAVNAYIACNEDNMEDKDIEWITVKGTHIPIKKGQSEEEAVKEFFDKKNKSYEERTEEKNKQISKDYALMRSNDFVKSIEDYPNSQKEILFTNDDNTWLLVESWKKGEEGWDLVKAGRIIQHFNDRYEAYDAHDKGYFANVDVMDKEKTFDEKKADIRPIKIKKSEIPQFENKKELSNWMKAQFEHLGSVKINDTGIDLRLSAGKANREAIKRRASKDENKAVIAKFKEIVSQAIKKDERKADDRHNKDQEIYFNKFQIDGKDYEVEIFVDKPYGSDKNSYYAGHSASKIEIAPRDTMNVSNDLTHYAKSANYIIPHLEIDFNPNITINKETNKFKKVFDYIRNTKGESMDNETKGLFSDLLNALKARNEAEEKDKKECDEKAANEDVDKRKLIDEVGGILKGKVDEELWRTIIGKIEKVAYDKSEAGTADNKAKNADEEEDKKDEAKNKCRNEDVDKRDLIRQIMAIAGKHEDNEDVRTIAKLAEKLAYDKSEAGTADNKCKNSDEEKLYEELKEKVEKEAENKKASNSLDALVNKLYSAVNAEYEPSYISPEKGIELGELIYGRK